MDYRGGDIKRQTRAVYGCLQGDKVNERGLSLWHRLHARSVCDAKAPLQLPARLVAIYVLRAFAFAYNEQTRMSSDIAYRTSEDSDEVLILISAGP